MALSGESVRKAWSILNEINPNAKNSFLADFEKIDEPLKLNTIIGFIKVQDGWENVFMYVKDITPEQRAIFERRKKEVPNSAFVETKGRITQIGWF